MAFTGETPVPLAVTPPTLGFHWQWQAGPSAPPATAPYAGWEGGLGGGQGPLTKKVPGLPPNRLFPLKRRLAAVEVGGLLKGVGRLEQDSFSERRP